MSFFSKLLRRFGYFKASEYGLRLEPNGWLVPVVPALPQYPRTAQPVAMRDPYGRQQRNTDRVPFVSLPPMAVVAEPLAPPAFARGTAAPPMIPSSPSHYPPTMSPPAIGLGETLSGLESESEGTVVGRTFAPPAPPVELRARENRFPMVVQTIAELSPSPDSPSRKPAVTVNAPLHERRWR